MKLKKALSLTALLASAGLGLAQEQPTDQAVVPVSTKPRTLMDSLRSQGQDRTPAAPTVGAGAAPQQIAPPPGQYVQPGQPMQPMPASGDCFNGYGYGNGVVGGGHSFYGGVEYLLWQMGPTFRSRGDLRLPGYRQDMPFTFGTRSITITDNGVDPITVDTRFVRTSLPGVATINPVVFSGNNVDSSDRNGVRLTLGMFLDGGQEYAVELRYFQLERKETSYQATATGLIRNIPNDLESEFVIPDVSVTPFDTVFDARFNALVSAESSNRLLGLDVNLYKNHLYVGPVTFSAIAGFRYLDFEESQHLEQRLDITDEPAPGQIGTFVGTVNGGAFTTGTASNFLFVDTDAQNKFLGGQVGGKVELNIGRFFANGTGTIAVGGMRQETSYTEVIGNNTGGSVPLAIHPGSVTFEQSRTRLTFVSELNLNVGCDCTDNLRAFVGYNLLFIRRIQRPVGGGVPASQSGNISADLSGTPARRLAPEAAFLEENLYPHGWNFGLELRF